MEKKIIKELVVSNPLEIYCDDIELFDFINNLNILNDKLKKQYPKYSKFLLKKDYNIYEIEFINIYGQRMESDEEFEIRCNKENKVKNKEKEKLLKQKKEIENKLKKLESHK